MTERGEEMQGTCDMTGNAKPCDRSRLQDTVKYVRGLCLAVQGSPEHRAPYSSLCQRTAAFRGSRSFWGRVKP